MVQLPKVSARSYSTSISLITDFIFEIDFVYTCLPTFMILFLSIVLS